MPFLNETQPEIWDELESRPELSASRGGFLLLLVSGPYFFVNEMLQVYFFLHCYINWTIITIFKTDFSCCDSRKPTPMCDAWSGPVYTLLSQRLLLQSNSDLGLMPWPVSNYQLVSADTVSLRSLVTQPCTWCSAIEGGKGKMWVISRMSLMIYTLLQHSQHTGLRKTRAERPRLCEKIYWK